jgi:hypothetical protein
VEAAGCVVMMVPWWRMVTGLWVDLSVFYSSYCGRFALTWITVWWNFE